MIGFTAQRLMESEVAGLTGAGHGERRPDRLNWRNGYRERDWETRAGTVELRIPKLTRGSNFPALLEPRRMRFAYPGCATAGCFPRPNRGCCRACRARMKSPPPQP